mmetsp:Transcript_122765/g.393210  ORF Transcript_122765/g.393210 Transcript_122765/m.393210 type:complete len:322 (+) Transcript_122765:468-1433(+)
MLQCQPIPSRLSSQNLWKPSSQDFRGSEVRGFLARLTRTTIEGRTPLKVGVSGLRTRRGSVSSSATPPSQSSPRMVQEVCGFWALKALAMLGMLIGPCGMPTKRAREASTATPPSPGWRAMDRVEYGSCARPPTRTRGGRTQIGASGMLRRARSIASTRTLGTRSWPRTGRAAFGSFVRPNEEAAASPVLGRRRLRSSDCGMQLRALRELCTAFRETRSSVVMAGVAFGCSGLHWLRTPARRLQTRIGVSGTWHKWRSDASCSTRQAHESRATVRAECGSSARPPTKKEMGQRVATAIGVYGTQSLMGPRSACTGTPRRPR